MKTTIFTVQNHDQQHSKGRSHLDIRILSPSKKVAWSWALPKNRFPEDQERMLIIKVQSHPAWYMNFEGSLKNGDKVSLFDKGKVDILKYNDHMLYLKFNGEKIKGMYYFIHLHKDNWIILKGKTNV